MKAPWARKEPATDVAAGSTKTTTAKVESTPIDRTAPKGRPTPKRRDAQPRRSGPVAPPPTSAKEARARTRTKNKKQREDVKAGRAVAQPTGLTRRDAGPERKLIRDVVDSKRHLASYFPLFAVVLLAVFFVGQQNSRLYNVVSLVWLAFFIVIIVESALLARSLRRRLVAEFPKTEEKVRSLLFYGVFRALMFRKGRYPKPEVPIGAKV